MSELLNVHITISTLSLTLVVTYLTFTIQLCFDTSDTNMAAPLTPCTKDQQCAVIQFL